MVLLILKIGTKFGVVNKLLRIFENSDILLQVGSENSMEFMKKIFRLNSLYLAKLGQSPITNGEDDTFFILEHKIIDVYNNRVYYETYIDVITDIAIVNRNCEIPMNIPEEIIELRPFSTEYCTAEELESGFISDIRVYQIYREINFNRGLIPNF